jgi:polyphosphate kinase
MNILRLALGDSAKSRVLNLDGTYSKIHKQGPEIINSQEIFLSLYSSENLPNEAASAHPAFVPIIS